MSALVIVLLLGLWASTLLPGALRERRGGSLTSSIDSFERSMTMLDPRVRTAARQPPGRHVMILGQPARVATGRPGLAARRRAVLQRLLLAVPVALAAAVPLGGAAWVLPVLAVAALGGYVTLLRQIQQQQELRAKVHRLPPARASQPAPAQAEDYRRARGA